MYKPFLPNPTLRNPSNFQFTSLLICANASRSIIGNCKEVVLKRNLNKIYVDSMMDWGVSLSLFHALLTFLAILGYSYFDY